MVEEHGNVTLWYRHFCCHIMYFYANILLYTIYNIQLQLFGLYSMPLRGEIYVYSWCKFNSFKIRLHHDLNIKRQTFFLHIIKDCIVCTRLATCTDESSVPSRGSSSATYRNDTKAVVLCVVVIGLTQHTQIMGHFRGHISDVENLL